MRAFFAVRVPAACFVMPFAMPFANDCQRQMLMDAVVIMDCWWHLVQTRPKYGSCAKFFCVSLVLFLFLSMSTYHVLVGRRQWNRVFCLDTRCVRSVENHVPAADCATVRIHAAGIVTLKTEIALQLSSIQKQAWRDVSKIVAHGTFSRRKLKKIQISCEIMIDGWHDHLMIPSRLLMNMEFHSNLFKLYRTLHAGEPAVRIAIMCWSNRGRLELSTNRQARTLSLVFPPLYKQSCTLLFFPKCRKILRVIAS